jgi:ribosomal protein S18 acetylase RimI-like enzyme
MRVVERYAVATSQREYSKDTMSAVNVTPVVVASDEILSACHRLIPQLSSSSRPITSAELAEIVDAEHTVLLAARSGTEIVGLLTLVVFRIPTAVRAWIEDVVVDESARGSGVGEALSRAALAEAARRGAKTVELTSRPSREAANRLYQRIGFVRRDTNVYRYEV